MRKAIIAVLALLLATSAFGQTSPRQVILQDAVAATGNGSTMSTAAFSTVAVQVTISDTATVTFEGTVDGSTWESASCVLSTGSTRVQTATATGMYQCNVAGLLGFRARVSSFSAGTVTVKAVGSGAVFASAVGAGSADAITGGGSTCTASATGLDCDVPAGGTVTIGDGTTEWIDIDTNGAIALVPTSGQHINLFGKTVNDLRLIKNGNFILQLQKGDGSARGILEVGNVGSNGAFTGVRYVSTGQTLASLSGTDGAITYCTDCQRTDPCTSGGTGAIAFRINGVNSCF